MRETTPGNLSSLRRGSCALTALLALTSPASCGGGGGGLPADGSSGGDRGNDGGGNGGNRGSDGGGSGGNRGDAGPGGVACVAVPACGGGVVGTWTITASCVSQNLDLTQICAGITAALEISFSGSVTYKADLTYVQTGSEGGDVLYHFPTACIGTQTCAQVQATLGAGSAMSGDLTFQSITCSSESTGCACAGVIANQPANETGTYSVAGGNLTSIHAGITDAAQYCVNEKTMHQMPPSGGGPTGAIVLTKQ